MLRIFVVSVVATAPAVTSRIGEERVDVATERVNAALDGLQKYFFDAKGQFWNAVCSHCSNVVCRSGNTHSVTLRSIFAVRTKFRAATRAGQLDYPPSIEHPRHLPRGRQYPGESPRAKQECVCPVRRTRG